MSSVILDPTLATDARHAFMHTADATTKVGLIHVGGRLVGVKDKWVFVKKIAFVSFYDYEPSWGIERARYDQLRAAFEKAILESGQIDLVEKVKKYLPKTAAEFRKLNSEANAQFTFSDLPEYVTVSAEGKEKEKEVADIYLNLFHRLYRQVIFNDIQDRPNVRQNAALMRSGMGLDCSDGYDLSVNFAMGGAVGEKRGALPNEPEDENLPRRYCESCEGWHGGPCTAGTRERLRKKKANRQNKANKNNRTPQNARLSKEVKKCSKCHMIVPKDHTC